MISGQEVKKITVLGGERLDTHINLCSSSVNGNALRRSRRRSEGTVKVDLAGIV